MAFFAGLRAEPGRLAAGLGMPGGCRFWRAPSATKGKRAGLRSHAENANLGRPTYRTWLTNGQILSQLVSHLAAIRQPLSRAKQERDVIGRERCRVG